MKFVHSLKSVVIAGVISGTIIAVAGAEFSTQREIEMQCANIGKEINTPGDDFYPSITADGLTMVFSIKPVDMENSDIYISRFTDGTWSPAEPIEVLNTKYDEQTPYISSDGKILIFSSNREGAIRPPKGQSAIYYLTNDLYISFYENGKWSAPQWLKGEVNTADNERAPSLSKDGKTLYFSRYSGDDIYSSKIYSASLEGISTSTVTLMPQPINSDYSDFGLMPSNSKPGFYFSSSRPGGLGLWDIYFVSFIDNKYGEPVNLGAPINSESNDLSITERENKIFFCSDRKEGSGKSDIYTITISTKVLKLPDTGFIFSVVDKKTRKAIAAKLEVSVNIDSQKEKEEEQDVKKYTIESNKKGECELMTDYYAKTIHVKPMGEHYKTGEISFTAKSGEMQRVTIELEEVEKQVQPLVSLKSDEEKEKKVSARQWKFRPIYFEYKSHNLSKEEMNYVKGIIQKLQNEKDLCVKLVGHTDPKGSYSYNIKLGYLRALAVHKALTRNGLKQATYNLASKGKEYPSALYKKTKQQKYNRRVEINIKECVDAKKQ